jgi:hypothetical protein
VQLDGSLTQTVTLLQPLASSLPMFVFLMATQNTNATKTTIKVYSTKPWPSSSIKSRCKSSICDFTSFRDGICSRNLELNCDQQALCPGFLRNFIPKESFPRVILARNLCRQEFVSSQSGIFARGPVLIVLLAPRLVLCFSRAPD